MMKVDFWPCSASPHCGEGKRILRILRIKLIFCGLAAISFDYLPLDILPSTNGVRILQKGTEK